MNYQQARIFCISAIIILVLLCIGGIVRCTRPTVDVSPTPVEQTDNSIPNKPEPRKRTGSYQRLQIDRRVGNLARQFADLNPEHLVYAEKLGIRPITSAKDILRLDRPIVEIKSNENFKLDKLTHSYAYLVPEAACLLDTIGTRFNLKLKQQNGGNYHILVTSLLRTQESVRRLRRGNVNSTENSAHLYGTTFDISYVDFSEGRFNTTKHSNEELKNLLAEVLLELREENRCLVKFERKQGCFHITAMR